MSSQLKSGKTQIDAVVAAVVSEAVDAVVADADSQILLGNCVEGMAGLPAESADAVISDPP